MTRTIGPIVALGLALGAVATSTFGANRESSTLAFLISKSDLGSSTASSRKSVRKASS